MITPDDLDRVRSLTKEFWDAEVQNDAFRGIFAGKEIGHRIADYVDEKTTAMLREQFNVASELDGRGVARARSMGDVWLQSGGMYNPINVKAGEAGKNGQPNMVSLTKLLDALLGREIDSYYLLIVKMRLVSLPAAAEVSEAALTPDSITPNVYLIDMLDYLDYVTFDAGPGQTMLKEKQFYIDYDAGKTQPNLAISTKVGRLIELLDDGDRRLAANRAKKMERMRADLIRYRLDTEHVVDQSGLNLG